jgi:small-conductance mechanosensitive channel
VAGRKQATSLSKSPWMMDPTRSREMPSCSAIGLAEIRRSSKISSWIWSIISGVVGLRTYQHTRKSCFWMWNKLDALVCVCVWCACGCVCVCVWCVCVYVCMYVCVYVCVCVWVCVCVCHGCNYGDRCIFTALCFKVDFSENGSSSEKCRQRLCK